MNYFIINPISGNSSQSKRKQLIRNIAKFPGNKILVTQFKDEANKLVKYSIDQGAKRIIAVGGDGTIREIASNLVNTKIPMGIIPLGSGNGLANHLKIPKNLSLALNLAMSGNPRKIDMGQVNGMYFLCTAGFGFDALVAKKFSKMNKRGIWGYLRAVSFSYFEYQHISASFYKCPQEDYFLLTLANTNQYGNKAYISPNSSITDGKLELIRIQKKSFIDYLTVGVRLFLKNLPKSKMAEFDSFQNLTFTIEQPYSLHLDGDYIPDFHYSSINVKTIPNALSIVY